MQQQNDQFQRIWTSALTNYEDIAGKRLNEPKLLKLSTVDALMQSLELEDKGFRKHRQTNHVFFEVLSGALKPIELVSNLAAGGASMAFPPSSLVFGAVTYLINAAKGVSTAYNAIQELFISLKDFTARLRVYTREAVSRELQEKLAQILTTLISVFALSREAIKHGRKWGFARNILVGGNEKVDAAVARLDKLTQSESRLVGAETLTESKRVGRTLDNMAVTVTASNVTLQDQGIVLGIVGSDVKEMRREFGQFTQAMDESRAETIEEKDQRHQDKLHEILRPSVNAQDLYDHISKKRVAGTGDWIRDERLFQSWLRRDKPLLWVTGNPGAGKSYLSANIISFLRDKNPQSVQSTTLTSVSYFFFKDSNPETRSFHQALRDLAYQICQNDPAYAKYVSSSCQSQEDIKTVGSAWRKLYVDFFIRDWNPDSVVYLVLDGVDEAYDAERKAFLELLNDLEPCQGQKSARIQLAMVGRPQLLDELNEVLEEEYLPIIHVTGDKTSDDIIQYIQTSIRKSKTLKLIPQDLKDEVVETLSTNAQGMFIWVDLMLQELYKKKRPSAIRDSLKKAPKGLNEMLRHVLESFSATLQDEDPDDLNEILAWVTCVERPLKLGELDMILRLRSAEGDGLLSLEGSLRTQYAAFFTLTREDGLTTAELQHISTQGLGNQSDTEDEDYGEEGLDDVESATYFNSDASTTEVTFCHASIGDFFRDESEGQVSAGEGYPLVGVAFDEAKVSICRTCLGLICDQNLREKNKDGISMIPYAQSNWYLHLQAVNRSNTTAESKQAIGQYIVRIFRDKEVLPLWTGNAGPAFFSNDNLSLIRGWLDDPEVFDTLSFEEHGWVKDTAKDPALTFMAAARYISAQWLQDVKWLPSNCFWILYATIELEKCASVSTDLPTNTTASEILRVAEWAGFGKNALWHRRVAMAMRQCALYDAAIEQFEESLSLETLEPEPTSWMARGGLSMVYVLRKDWKRAIELDVVNESLLLDRLQKVPEEETVLYTQLHSVQERMGECYGSLEDRRNALRCFKAASGNKKDCYKCANLCVRELIRTCQHAGLMGLLMGMREKLPGKEHTRLDELLWYQVDNINPSLLTAARETGNVQFLVDMYHNNIIAARRKLKIGNAIDAELGLAYVYRDGLNEVDKAMRIWSRLLRMSEASAKEESLMGAVRARAVAALAAEYFQRASEASRGSSEQSAAVHSLEQLVGAKKDAMGETTEVMSTSPAALFLGQWYRLNGQKSAAYACFKVHVKEALRILSDDDPDNDMDGYMRLATILSADGHDAKAIGILQSVLLAAGAPSQADAASDVASESSDGEHCEEEAMEKGEASEPDEKESIDDTELLRCDGLCGKGLKDMYPLAMCRYCIDVGICQDCLKLVKEGKMPMRLCAPNHDWLLVPAPTQRPEEGTIIVGGEVVGLEDFKQGLREEWKV